MENSNEKENLQDNIDQKLRTIKTNHSLKEVDETPNWLENNKCEICDKYLYKDCSW